MLREIRDDAMRHAAPLPLNKSAQPERQGLGFQIGGIRLVSPMGEVAEILKLPKLTYLPGVREWVLGVANVRGRLIPVIDMHRFVELTPTLPTSQWRVLVVEDEDLIAGLLVEQSLGMQHFLADSFEPVPDETLAVIRPFVNGVYRHGGRLYFETNLKSVLRDERFFDVAE